MLKNGAPRSLQVLIVGAGDLGRQSAHRLIGRGYHVTVVEKDSRTAAEVRHSLGGRVFHGDGCDPQVLERSGIARMQVVVAVTGEDEDNLVIAELARRFFGVARVLARVNNPDNEWLFTALRGVDIAFSPARLMAELVEDAIDSGAEPDRP